MHENCIDIIVFIDLGSFFCGISYGCSPYIYIYVPIIKTEDVCSKQKTACESV